MRWREVLLEKQRDHEVINRLPASYQNRKFITVLTTAPYLPQQNRPRAPTHFLKTNCHNLTHLRLCLPTAPNLIFQHNLLRVTHCNMHGLKRGSAAPRLLVFRLESNRY